MQVCARTVSPLSIFWIWLLVSYTLLRTTPEHGETRCATHAVRNDPTEERRNSRKILVCQKLIASHETEKLSRHNALLSIFFEDNEAVIKMISKGTSATMRHIVALGW